MSVTGNNKRFFGMARAFVQQFFQHIDRFGRLNYSDNYVCIREVEDMGENRKSVLDRRSGFDRRMIYKLGYFVNGGIERRSGKERRSDHERRKEWINDSELLDVLKGDIKTT